MFCVLSQLRRECSLAELMDQETCMVKQIRSLDSDMQTLVYENYNKFISATGELLVEMLVSDFVELCVFSDTFRCCCFLSRHHKKDEERFQKDGG